MKLFDTDTLLTQAEALAATLRELEHQQGMAKDEVEEREKEHDEIVHRMENPRCLYPERARLATRLSHAQRTRRALKDWLVVTKPLLAFAGSVECERLGKHLEKLIAAGRSVAEEKRRRCVSEQRLAADEEAACNDTEDTKTEA